nr:BREX-2 system phosphatase PglZ [Kibdelosporangium sp. MJ126-NF4]CEL19292.1 bacteriophage (phiC31) resistance gene pglZ [Kibdelosporangium sp. MJ126-NF4]CTQ94909.1 bacteriophage (phiC31) resistance gene pglZ [Kibdelosporangium sp. MJ126-NF4]
MTSTTQRAESPLPLATEQYIRSLVEQAPTKGHHDRVLVIRTRPVWNGPKEFLAGQRRVRVEPCVSALAVREAMVGLNPGEVLVVLTDREDADLGSGILAHCIERRAIPVQLWDAVRARFQVRADNHIDARLALLGDWAAQALVEYAPVAGWPPAPGGVLTRDHALGSLVHELLGMDAEGLDAAAVLQWSNDLTRLRRFEALPRPLQNGLAEWISSMAGPVAKWVFEAAKAGHGGDALPLGIVADVLWLMDSSKEPREQATLRTRAQGFFLGKVGGEVIAEAHARAWAMAARAWAERVIASDEHGADIVLAQAQRILDHDLHAGPLAGLSTLLPGGLAARLRTLAEAVLAVLPASETGSVAADRLVDVEEALRVVQGHVLAALSGEREQAEMAMRCLRWLSTPTADAKSLTEAATLQSVLSGWVDRARDSVWLGHGDERIAEAYQRIYRAVARRRTVEDQRFAELLAQATGDDVDPGGLLVVESVLSKVVVPLAKQTGGVLLVIADGMSTAVATQLGEAISRVGWTELVRTTTGNRAGVLSTLPSLTESSRASLLLGHLATGVVADEKAGFADAAGVGSVVFHKGDLDAGAGRSLPSDIVRAIDDPQAPVVAVVLNAVDDAVHSKSAMRMHWDLEALRPLRDLLHRAFMAGRAVVVAADHGHVLHRDDGELRSNASAVSARWRPATSPLGDGELEFHGRRVLTESGRVVLPWRESVRYTARRAGYHGGAAPAEVVAPLLVYVRDATVQLRGWQEASAIEPRWWYSPMPVATAAEEPVAIEYRYEPGDGGLFDVGQSKPVTDSPVSPVTQVLSSEVYRAQAKRIARGALSKERVHTVLQALMASGGRLHATTLAGVAGIPVARLRQTMAALQRLLNVEGYQVIGFDRDGVTVVLDLALLSEQFGVPL